MSEQQGQLPIDIASVAAKGKFLTIVDAIGIGKVKLTFTQYDVDTGTANGTGDAYINIRTARVLIEKLKAIGTRVLLDGVSSLPAKMPPILELFGGGGWGDEIESRVLRVLWDTADGKFAAKPYRFEVAIGKGIRSGNGAIQPDPSDNTKRSLWIRLTVDEAWEIAKAMEAYFCANGKEIFEQQAKQQIEKREKRQEKKGGRFSVAPKKKLPISFRGYPAGTMVADMDAESLEVLAEKTKTMPALAKLASELLNK